MEECMLRLKVNYDADPTELFVSPTMESPWNKPQIDYPVSLERGVQFEIQLLNDAAGFRVRINDNDAFTYAHRSGHQPAKHLYIKGDVFIKSVLFS